MKRDACRVVVFAREPVPGRVKTRLIPFLGAERAAALYRQLIDHAIQVAIASAIGQVEIWHTPDATPCYLRQLADYHHLPCLVQIGDDLGKRMYFALAQALSRAEYALVIGTDCPSLTPDDLRQAIEALEEVDVVISPAEDGGYVLLGLKRPIPQLFAGIPWGESRVLEETLARCQAMQLRYRSLSSHWDVDRPEDVDRLIHTGWHI